MAKSASKRPETAGEPKSKTKGFVPVNKKTLDPGLASLFASSLGPVKQPPKSRYESIVQKETTEDSSEEEEEGDEEDDEILSSLSGSEASDDDQESDNGSEDVGESEAGDGDSSEDEKSEADHEDVLAKVQESILSGNQDRTNKKRKRKEDDLESSYMQKLAREEEKEEEKRKKKAKTEALEQDGNDESDEDVEMGDGDAKDDADDSDEESFVIPKHETQMESTDNDKAELEKAARTVFLGNVSSEAVVSKSAKKTLMKHLASFIEDLADNKPPHKVESIRFRSTAFASALPKKAAFAKKEVMDSTTKSTNAYAVYSTKLAAREAVKRLNGTVVLGRHLRVDSVAHPAQTDHRRCVFVGNLGFVDDESNINAADGEKKKNKPPGDVEEGLWVQFSKAGKVESVRVVRDSKTRVGKGFAYVQFEDENGVEAALQFNDQKYPPLLPRKLRVVRAKAQKQKKPSAPAPKPTPAKGTYRAKPTAEQKTHQGRARTMLGKAGAFKSAESFVFEGHRASSKQGNTGLKLGGKKKGPNGRKKRSAAWKSSGGKK
ncbi:hypothetical protein BS50DRAFT_530549 [Corynespora cassiicola Philippines]|uniref:Nucleolar protein 12 n=1 Tax=Corynespora cassiicola Philippines TaxID=1448308 RepID=A0A2T2NC18_CORCC|nr:hypothetical protein BS50DRAFT_530549 [Corynespora cassiicola Philippines]